MNNMQNSKGNITVLPGLWRRFAEVGHVFRSAAAVALVSAGMMIPAAAQEQIVLKVAHNFPNSIFIWGEWGQVFVDHVEKATDGKVKFEIYPSNQLGKDMVSVLESGIADIALIVPSYTPEKLPLSSVAELPGQYQDSCEGNVKLWNIARPGGLLDQAEYAPRGIRLLSVAVQPPYIMFTTRKPPENLEALQGLKLRATGSSMSKAARDLGAIPVQVPTPELADALMRGTLDGAIFSYIAMPDFELERSLKFSAEGPRLGSGIGVFGIRSASWEKLPDDIKRIFEEAAGRAQEHVCEWQETATAQIQAQFVANDGHTVIKLSPEEIARWEDAVSGVTDTWLQEITAAGKDGKSMLEAFNAQ